MTTKEIVALRKRLKLKSDDFALGGLPRGILSAEQRDVRDRIGVLMRTALHVPMTKKQKAILVRYPAP